MRDSRNLTGIHTDVVRGYGFHRLTALFLVFLASFLVALAPWRAQADQLEDEYLRIFTVIQEADFLDRRGQAAQAEAKYREAQTALLTLKKTNPNWNPRMVGFRLSYVIDKLAPPAEIIPSGTSSTAPGTTTKSATATTAAGTQTVKLLQPGAEPRTALRFHPKAGEKQALTMKMKMGMAMKMGEMDVPGTTTPVMTLAYDVTVKEVAADGTITYEMVLGDCGVAENDGATGPLADAMAGSLEKMKGMTTTARMTDRGVYLAGGDLKMGSEADPGTRQVIDQIQNSMSQVGAYLPEEPVGVGAKWESRSPVKTSGMRFDQSTVYELVSADGDKLELKCTLTQSAANQKVENPSMPGMKLDLVKMRGTGAGTISMNLGQPMPSAGKMDLQSEFSMGMKMGGQQQTMDMKLDINMTMESK